MTLKGFKLTFSTVALEGGRVVFFFFFPGNLGGSGCWGLRAGGGKGGCGGGSGNGLERPPLPRSTVVPAGPSSPFHLNQTPTSWPTRLLFHR